MQRATIALVLLAAACSAAPPVASRWMYPAPRHGGRIVGGESVNVTQFPWQVAIELADGHVCGGSIISSNWVLTTAHNLDGLAAEFLAVRAGTSTLGSGGAVYEVTEKHGHVSFSWTNGDYDIAALAINGSFVFDLNVQAVNLADAELAADTSVNTTGWGYTDIIGPLSEQLLVVNTVTIEQSACNVTWEGTVTDNMFCTLLEGKSSCTGDGGGAVVVGDTQYGIFSRTMCGNNDIPDVHTSIAALRSWINETTGV